MYWKYIWLLIEELGGRTEETANIDRLYQRDPEVYEDAYRKSFLYEHPNFRLYPMSRAAIMKKVVGMLSKNGAAIYRGELARMMHYGYYLTGNHLMMHGPKESNWVVGNIAVFADKYKEDEANGTTNGNAKVVTAYIWHLAGMDDTVEHYFGKELEEELAAYESRMQELEGKQKDPTSIQAREATKEVYQLADEWYRRGATVSVNRLLEAFHEEEKTEEIVRLLLESLRGMRLSVDTLKKPACAGGMSTAAVRPRAARGPRGLEVPAGTLSDGLGKNVKGTGRRRALARGLFCVWRDRGSWVRIP